MRFLGTQQYIGYADEAASRCSTFQGLLLFSEVVREEFAMAVADDIFIWAVKCTNGEISTDMRLVALEVNGASVTFRYYLDKEPSDFTRE